jgi:hypothetical protein
VILKHPVREVMSIQESQICFLGNVNWIKQRDGECKCSSCLQMSFVLVPLLPSFVFGRKVPEACGPLSRMTLSPA